MSNVFVSVVGSSTSSSSVTSIVGGISVAGGSKSAGYVRAPSKAGVDVKEPWMASVVKIASIPEEIPWKAMTESLTTRHRIQAC